MKIYIILGSILLTLFFVLPIATQAVSSNCLKEGEEKSLMPLPTGGQDNRVCCAGLVFKSTLPACPGCATVEDVDTCVKSPIVQNQLSFRARLWQQIYAIQKQLLILLRLQKLQNLATSTQPVACTMEAKVCPDGVTYVGRQGPKCEFAPCPFILQNRTCPTGYSPREGASSCSGEICTTDLVTWCYPSPTIPAITTTSTCGERGKDSEVRCHPGTTTQGLWINQDNPANWPTYNDSQFKYQIRYPADTKVRTFQEDGSLVKELGFPVDSNKASLFIAFPKSESCGRYGPGVASKRISESISLGGDNYQVSGWVEDPLNYSEWYRNNPRYGDPLVKDYSKTINLCDVSGKFSITYTFEVKNVNGETAKVKEIDSLIKNVLKTFKFI